MTYDIGNRINLYYRRNWKYQASKSLPGKIIRKASKPDSGYEMLRIIRMQ